MLKSGVHRYQTTNQTEIAELQPRLPRRIGPKRRPKEHANSMRRSQDEETTLWMPLPKDRMRPFDDYYLPEKINDKDAVSVLGLKVKQYFRAFEPEHFQEPFLDARLWSGLRQNDRPDPYLAYVYYHHVVFDRNDIGENKLYPTNWDTTDDDLADFFYHGIAHNGLWAATFSFQPPPMPGPYKYPSETKRHKWVAGFYTSRAYPTENVYW
ncbi:MAG: hypothetical protein M1837_001389 [Sclerophora amabilis]|nr:MAG: hypothetical protein M1837_001389 [Sclerophora amabilis]